MTLLIKILKRTVEKFSCAFKGLKAGILYDRSILLQIILAGITLVFFALIRIGTVEWLFIISAIFIVLIAEFLNSAIEDVCDLLVKKYDLHVKEIKDISSAAVLLAAVYAVIVAGIILIGRFI